MLYISNKESRLSCKVLESPPVLFCYPRFFSRFSASIQASNCTSALPSLTFLLLLALLLRVLLTLLTVLLRILQQEPHEEATTIAAISRVAPNLEGAM
jgi:hypothetical protein